MLKRSLAMIGVAALLAGGVVAGTSSAAVRIVPTKIVSVNKFVGHVFFAPGSSDLGSDDKAFLLKLSKTHAKATLLGVVGYVQAGGSTANDISLSLARANSVADYLRSVGFKPNIRTAGRGAHPTVKNSPLARRVTIYATYRFSTGGGSTGGGSTGGGSTGGDLVDSGDGTSGSSSPCGDTPAVFQLHVIFPGQETALNAAAQSTLSSALRASSKASIFGVVGYVPPSGSTEDDRMIAKARVIATATFMRQKGFAGKINTYSRTAIRNSTTTLSNRVSIYTSFPIAEPVAGKCPAPTPTPTVSNAPATNSLSGTFDAVANFADDDIYMTGASISGPMSKSLTTPADISDGDNKQYWRFANLKSGTYLVTIKMHVNDTGGCLSLLASNGDGTAIYDGMNGGWDIDPTDEFCEADSDFTVFQYIPVKGTVSGQNFTFGFADCFNQDICFGVEN